MINNVQPQRLPGLVEKVWGRIAGRTPDIGPQPNERATTQSGRVLGRDTTQADALSSYFTYDVQRQQVYSDVEEMDRQSEEFHTALSVIANNANASEDGEQDTFQLYCEQANARRELEAMFERTNIHELMKPWTRSTLKYGDSFLEVVVNKNLDVVRVRLLPARQMNRNEDDFGVLALGRPQYIGGRLVPGYKVGTSAFEQMDADHKSAIAAFMPWQIIHLRWDWDGESTYGTSLGFVPRVTFRKLKALEESLVVGRLTRAFLKFIFHVDTTGLPRPKKEEVLDDFTREIQEKQTPDARRRTPWNIFSDLVLSAGWLQIGNEIKEQRTNVQLIDPKNEAITNIADVKFVHRKLVSQLHVPPAHTGWEEDVNSKATLTHQDVQYVRILHEVQRIMGAGVDRLCEIQLILKGYDPKRVKRTIRWPSLSAADDNAAADAENKRAMSDAIYFEMEAIDREFMQRHRFGMDDVEIKRVDSFFKELKVQKQKEAADAAAAAAPPAPEGSDAPGTSPGNTNGNVPSMSKQFQKQAVDSSAS